MCLGAGLKDSAEKVQREWVLLLHHLVTHFPALFPAYQPLLNANPDLDFFLNITHIQAHRRARAIARLRPLLPAASTADAVPSPSPTLAPSVLVDVVLPLVNHVIFSSGGQGLSTASLSSLDAHQRDRMRRSQNNTAGADHGLIEESVVAIGVISRALSWSQWYSLLQMYLRQVRARTELERMLVRVICGVLDAWHFNVLEGGSMSEEERASERVAVDNVKTPLQRKPADHKPTAAGEQALGEHALGEQKEDKEVKNEPAAADQSHGAIITEEDADDSVEAAAEDDATPTVDGMEVEGAAVSVPEVQRARTLALKVRHVLSTSLLPHLHSLLSGRSRGDALSLLRPSVALAIVHLLLRLPSDFFDLHFSRLLTALLSQLQRREQDARDVARRVLVDAAVAVGAVHVSRILREASGMLKRGYQTHVLGYLTWAVLNRMVKDKASITPTDIDSAVDQVMVILMEELLGEVGREKEVDAIRRSAREARAAKAFDTIECLAELCSFGKVEGVVEPLRAALLTTVRSEEVKKMKEGLRRVGEGLTRNSSVDVKDLVAFVYAAVKDASDAGTATRRLPKRVKAAASDDDDDEDEEELTAVEKAARMRKSKEVTFAVKALATPSVASAAPSAHHNLPVLLHFALSLLHSALKHNKLHEFDPAARALLDRFLPLLSSTTLLLTPAAPTRGASVVSADVIDVSLRVCNVLLRWSALPSLPAFVSSLAPFLFSLLNGAESSLLPSAFKTLSILIHHSRQSFTGPQLTLLFSFIREELLTPSDHSFVFPLLHAILTRRLLHPDLYDCMDRVAELLVTSASAKVREAAAGLFLLFLLDYPVGEKRMQHHLTFLIQNLGYAVVGGRMAVLGMLESVVVRFPVSVLDGWLELLLFPLVCALTNEEEEEGRERVGCVLRLLAGRVSADKQRQVAAWVHQWMTPGAGGEVEDVRRCGAMQCYGMMVEGMGATFARFADVMMTHVRDVITEEEHRQTDVSHARVEGTLSKEEDDNDVRDSAAPLTDDAAPEEGGGGAHSPSADWRLLYFTLVTLEKALSQPAPLVDAFLVHVSPTSPESSLFPSLVSFLLHPHTWIRSVATRLLSALLRSSPALSSAQTLRLLKVCCKQLDGDRLGDKLAQHAVDNLIRLTSHSLTVSWDDPLSIKAEDEDDGDVDDAKEPSANRPSLASLRAMVDMSRKNRGLNWTFHRLSYMARQPGHVKRLSILRFFRHVVESLDYAVWAPYLLPLLHALFRLANAPDYNAESAVVKEQAAVLMEDVQGRVGGGGVFLAYYNAVRGGVMEVRRERREKRKVMAVVAPALYANRKQDKHDRKRVSRKRKMEGVKLAKGIAGVTRIDRERSDAPTEKRTKRRKTA